MAIRETTWLALLFAVAAFSVEAEAQRPFATLDPFNHEESARRVFYDGFAVQGDFAYRGTEPTVAAGARITPFALSVRLDYALARQLDVGAVVDASGGFDGSAGNSPVRLNWLIVKPYWRHQNTDYALRIAVDPAGDGGFGFRQTDVSFISSTDLSPTLSTDISIGLRRAAVGFERVEFDAERVVTLVSADARPEIIRARATGTEVHLAWGYRYWLHPSGTHVFSTFSAEGMAYRVVSTRPAGQPPPQAGSFDPTHDNVLRGGVGRFSLGVEYSRPSFLVAPYFSLPLFRWVQVSDDSRMWGPRVDHSRFGLRVTVR